jgi:hypothetical protein
MGYSKKKSVVTWLVTRHGVGLVIGFIGRLQLVATGNHIAIANSRALLFTIAHTKSSQYSLGVAWQRMSTMSSVSAHTSLPGGYHLTTGPQLAIHSAPTT